MYYLYVYIYYVTVGFLMLERELHCLHRAIHLIFVCVIILTRTCLCNILRYFSGVKTEHFHQKEVGIPNIFVQSMHRGYMF